MLHRIREWARAIKRDPRTPWCAKALAMEVAAYALSPIDRIPDLIPVLGHLDDALLVPLGIMLAVPLMPPELMAKYRAAAAAAEGKPGSRAGAAFIVAVWLLAAASLLWWFWRGAAQT